MVDVYSDNLQGDSQPKIRVSGHLLLRPHLSNEPRKRLQQYAMVINTEMHILHICYWSY